MSAFSPEEEKLIGQMAALIQCPWNYAAKGFEQIRDRYVPPGWTPARAGYVSQLLAGRKQRRAKAK